MTTPRKPTSPCPSLPPPTTAAAQQPVKGGWITLKIHAMFQAAGTDSWVKSKIYAQYLTESALDDSNVDIDVTNGVVTLNGTVKTAAGKARAVVIAKATDRVRSVKDKLKVG